MQASETKLRQLIEGTKQYVVPLFQRPYSWSRKQWKILWDDVVEQSKNDGSRPHFFGSIVTTPAKSVPEGVQKYLLIDGQQRMTTIQVLLAALRDSAQIHEPKLRDRIEGQFLTNGFDEGDERLKVLPTQEDRAAFRSIILRTDGPDHRLVECYRFFKDSFDRISPSLLDSLHLAVVNRLSLVSITCDEHDNPHLIFESLNAKGEKLTPADLIRNFLLMRVHVGDQSRLFEAYWLPMQQALGDSLTEFVRHYLMKEGRILGVADVYFELKDRLANAQPRQAEAFLEDLHRHGMYYSRFLDPARENDPEIAERLERLKRLKFTVVHPMLLRVFHSYAEGALTHGQVLETFDLLEAFLVRRLICNVPTNQLRKMLPPIFDAVGGAGPDYLSGLRSQFGGKRCPDDVAFSAALKSERLYSTAEKNARLRLILERLERSFGHKEQVDFTSAQIEHVMPQTLNEEWKGELGPNAALDHERYVHTLGNLTLTKYNAELSNCAFARKRVELARSHFELNRHFQGIEKWTAQEIENRAEHLAGLAVAIWRDPGRTEDPTTPKRRIRLSAPPSSIRFQTDISSVSSWKNAYLNLIERFERHSPGLLKRITEDPSVEPFVARDAGRFARSKSEIAGVFLNTHASASQLRDWTKKIAKLAGIGVEDYEFQFATPSQVGMETPRE